MDKPKGTSSNRLAELVASLSLATDLATGQPLENGLRRTLLAVWLGEALGLSDEDLSTTYYVSLAGSVGCILDGAALAEFFADEIAIRQEMVLLDPSNALKSAVFFLSHAGQGQSPWRRLGRMVAIPSQAQVVCRDVALHVGELLDLGPGIRQSLGQCDEQWLGKGPLGLEGEEISVPARLFLLAHDVEIFTRIGGTAAALAVVRQRAGKVYDPQFAARFRDLAESLFARMQSVTPWEAVLDAEPLPRRLVSESELSNFAGMIANFIDMRSMYTVGHSLRMATLAESAARRFGLADSVAIEVRQAGLLHDIGRAGVPVAAWNKKEPLTASEWDRMKRHPSMTELVLARSEALGPLGMIAGLHHERMDGSGYRGVSATSIPITAQLLAAADTYQTKLEGRPHRLAMKPEVAAEELLQQSRAGAFDATVVEALLDAAGHQPRSGKSSRPAGLSEREVEILLLLVRGLSNREMAEMLFLSPKTVGHHVESIYNKIGVSTRVGATLFALQHALISPSS